jgi:hypothetical protein
MSHQREVLVLDPEAGAQITRVALPQGGSAAHMNSARISPDHNRIYASYGAFRQPML